MGANFCHMSLPGALDRNAVKAMFQAAQDEDRYENGHSYSGGFGMADGLEFPAVTFATLDEAGTYLEDTAQKWEAALCVTVATPEGTLWLIGAWCAS